MTTALVPPLPMGNLQALADNGNVDLEEKEPEKIGMFEGELEQSARSVFVPQGDDDETAVEYLQRTVQPVVTEALDKLLHAQSLDPDINAVAWLAAYLKDHNVANAARRAYETREAAVGYLTEATSKDDVYKRCCKALRDVFFPCTATVCEQAEIIERVEIPATEKQIAEWEEKKAADKAAKIAEAEAAAEAAAAAAKGKKAPPKTPAEEQPEVEEVEEPMPKFYKKVKSRVLQYVSTSHIDPTSIEGRVLRKRQGVTWATALKGLTLHVKDIASMEKIHLFGGPPPLGTALPGGSYVSVPLFEGSTVLACLCVDTMHDAKTITEEDLIFIERVADVASNQLEVIAREAEEQAALDAETAAIEAAAAAEAAEAAAAATKAAEEKAAEEKAAAGEGDGDGDGDGAAKGDGTNRAGTADSKASKGSARGTPR